VSVSERLLAPSVEAEWISSADGIPGQKDKKGDLQGLQNVLMLPFSQFLIPKAIQPHESVKRCLNLDA